MDFIPRKDSEKIVWNNNLNAKIDVEGPALGLTAAEVTQVKTVTAANSLAIKASDDAQTASKAARASKDAQLATGNKVLRLLVKKIKTNNAYNSTRGTNLQIIGEDPGIDYTTYKPTIKATVMPGRVRIDFTKDGLDGLDVYTRLKGESVWTKLAYDSYSPYEDNRPLADAITPEHREYMAIGVVHDEEVTQQSDIIEAVFGG